MEGSPLSSPVRLGGFVKLSLSAAAGAPEALAAVSTLATAPRLALLAPTIATIAAEAAPGLRSWQPSASVDFIESAIRLALLRGLLRATSSEFEALPSSSADFVVTFSRLVGGLRSEHVIELLKPTRRDAPPCAQFSSAASLSSS